MRAMSSPHLLIAFAACNTQAWLPAMQALPRESTHNLRQLLQGMKRVHSDEGDEHTLSPPHERALARALGLATAETPDGLIPWAASDAAEQLKADPSQGWAWITPCHWAMGSDHVTLTNPEALALHEDESRVLLAAMQPYFETDGITLHYLAPTRWLAQGELFRTLPTASLDRVLRGKVDDWLPGTGAGERSAVRAASSVGASTLRRLQNEMQMLLYTLPLNDLRAARRQLPVNSFWISGTGALPAGKAGVAHSQGEREKFTLPRSLALAVFNDDWAAYAQAWA